MNNEENKTYIYIKDIKDSIIPDYQRGYKWEVKNVEDLLNDIDDIDNTKKTEHCLHNLTIIEKDNNWEVIDGQQRLTTIFLILKYLDKEYYKLSYKIREETKSFLDSEINNIIKSLKENENEDKNKLFNKVKENNKYDKQDIYYICQALSTIHNWFKDKKEQEKSFIEKLESVYFYTHKIENEIIKGETAFANLNSGKVALTDIELIKADLIINISIKKAKDKDEILINEIRSNIGRLWDEMESWLAQDEVWYWISPKKNETNKLSLLFNLCEEFKVGNNIYEKYYNYIYKNKTDEDATEKLWEKIINYYYTIKDWYLDNDMYHLIGIIIYFDIKIKEFLGNKYSTKNELKNKLKSKIIEKVKLITENNELKFKEEINKEIKEINYVELNYVENHKDLNKIFILLNCLEGYNYEKNIFYEHFRYRFDIHNKNKWSIEHIIPQKSTEEDSPIHTIAIYNSYFTDKSKAIHFIKNLALLEGNVNSSLKNNNFKEKRKMLLKKVDEGAFIPPLTLKVFSKTFIDADTEKDYWTDNDFNKYEKYYEKYQEEQLKNFINPLNEKGNDNNE